MTSREIRESFLQFFESRGHTRVKSDLLVPDNDPTLLFTGAGMNQFKAYFMHAGHASYTRATSSQKCLRTGDIESVGRTASHHTFFEMLGNFSFGDYFKDDAILWAWEFLTQELHIPRERLSVSVYRDDDEAYTIWKDKVGIPDRRIYRFGEKENFWPASAPSRGPNGPCGPCSEIFYDQGEDRSCGAADCDPSCDCDRYVEIWNLVFTQFDRKDGGILDPLPQKNIDTGMGLERITAVLQGAATNFETDLFLPILHAIEQLSGTRYSLRTGDAARMRRIADHIRAITVAICDGVHPSNEGRGYVIRRLTRRALLDGKQIGMDEPFMHKLVPVVVDILKGTYAELEMRQNQMMREIENEEVRFVLTLDRGLAVLEDHIQRLRQEKKRALSGKDVFQLYDTYGFPLEMTEEILSSHGMRLNKREYHEEMEKQKKRSRDGTNISKDIFATDMFSDLKQNIHATQFVGYTEISVRAVIRAILLDNESVAQIASGQEANIILDTTPFYAEGGGQVGDQGAMSGRQGSFQIRDTRKKEGFFLHLGRVTEGVLRVGDEIRAEIDAARREDTQRNHTATHLLHWALAKQLGTHISQKGSYVGADRLRFDFNHHEAISRRNLQELERLVNEHILLNHHVTTREMPLEEARRTGAKALFGEKYGEMVRVVETGAISRELCGGTHVACTGQIGAFKIVKEESVGAGVRRIEAVTGIHSLRLMQKKENLLNNISRLLKSHPEQLEERIRNLILENKEWKKKTSGQSRKIQIHTEELLANAEKVDKVALLALDLGEASADDLRRNADALRKQPIPFAAILAARKANRPLLVVCSNVTNRIDSSSVVRAAAQAVGGGGGGRADFAQAGGKHPEAIPEALEQGLRIMKQSLSKQEG